MKVKLFFLKLKIEQFLKHKIWKNLNLFSLVLLPFSLLYSIGYYIKFYFDKKKQKKFDIPIICVGNLEIGGGGKTPFVLGLSQYLQDSGANVAVVSRGYGRKSKIISYIKVNLKHSAAEVGDEPLLLARHVPTYVAEKRQIAIEAAQNDGAEIILFDDGLQNQSIFKDFSIVVINGKHKHNCLIIPAGPLREPAFFGFKRVQAIVVIDPSDKAIIQYQKKSDNLEIFFARTVVLKPEKYANRSFIALVGIATPQKFLQSCRDVAANIIATYEFSDHYLYQVEDIKPIYEEAISKNCTILTTTKDFVRIPPEFTSRFEVLEIVLQTDYQKIIDTFKQLQNLNN